MKTTTTEPYYSNLEGYACRFTNVDAWLYGEKGWNQIHPAVPNCNGKLLSKEVFEKVFPDLPPLPDEAFK